MEREKGGERKRRERKERRKGRREEGRRDYLAKKKKKTLDMKEA